jgi:ubiquinone/menaquinone biosynthesis C-methylase UbiE
MKKDTSWGGVSDWYDSVVENTEGSYQSRLILPNLTRLMEIKEGESILDIACGQGFFTREFKKLGADVSGADISPELIKIGVEKSGGNVNYFVAESNNLSFAKNSVFDKACIVLALQNISDLEGTIKEAGRILKKGGKLYLVLNHPAFRVPQKSDWGYDDKKAVQFRKVEQYLSELMVKIDMNPGEKDIKNKKYTVSFHRPLQTYFKVFHKNNFMVSKMEEWVSDKKSEKGLRQKSEDKARIEIPIFMFLEVIKM